MNRIIVLIFVLSCSLLSQGLRSLNGSLNTSQKIVWDTTGTPNIFKITTLNGVHTLWFPYQRFDSSVFVTKNTTQVISATKYFTGINYFKNSNLFEPDSGTTTQSVVYIRSYDSIGSQGAALDISSRKGSSTPVVIHNYSNKVRAALQIDNTSRDGSMLAMLRLRNATNPTLGDFGLYGNANYIAMQHDTLSYYDVVIDKFGAISQGKQFSIAMHEMANYKKYPYFFYYADSASQARIRGDSAGNLQSKNYYPLDDSTAYLGTASSRPLQIHGINQNLRGGMVIGSSTINAALFPLTVYGTDSANSLTSTPTGALAVGNANTILTLYMGVNSIASPSYAWIQARPNNNINGYDLVLNPNGGNFVYGNAGSLSTTTRFQIKNGLLASALNVYNSRGTSLVVVDSSGKIGLGGTPASYIDITNATTTLDLRLTNSASNGARMDFNSTLSGQVKNFRVGRNIISNLKEFAIYDVTNALTRIYIKDDGAIGFNNVIPSGSGITSKNGLFSNARVYTNSRGTTIASIDSNGSIASTAKISADSSFTINERATTPDAPTSNTQMHFYMKGDKIIWQINAAGTQRWYYFDATAVANQSIIYSATAP